MDLANDDHIRKLIEQIQNEKDVQKVIDMAGELVRLLDQKHSAAMPREEEHGAGRMI